MNVRRALGRRFRPRWTALAVALAALGCSGGGSGSDPVTCTSLSFDRSLATPTSGDVYLDQAAGTCSTVDVGVLVSGLSGIWSVSFDLSYPASLLEYQSYTLGPLLQKGSPAVPPKVFVNAPAGEVQVSMTLFTPDPAVSAVGSESLITLRFARKASGSGPIDFDTSGGSLVAETILDQLGAPQPAIFGPGHGGMVVVP